MDLSTTIVYARGGFRAYEDAKVGLLTHGLQYGTGCFEGIRGYWSGEKLNVLFLREHFRRLERNAAMLMMKSPTAEEERLWKELADTSSFNPRSTP